MARCLQDVSERCFRFDRLAARIQHEEPRGLDSATNARPASLFACFAFSACYFSPRRLKLASLRDELVTSSEAEVPPTTLPSNKSADTSAEAESATTT